MTRGQKIRVIFSEVCLKHGVTKEEVISTCRIRRVVFCRMEIAYRLRTETTLSFPQIGGVLQRDHSTVFYYVERVSARLKDGPWPIASYAKPARKLRKIAVPKPACSRPIPKPTRVQVSAINRYWDGRGVQANARAEHIGRRIIIKSDLQMVT